MSLHNWLGDFLNLFFPNNCQACGNSLFKQEHIICFSCIYKLPKTGFHMHEENPVSRVFWGRADVNAATSFLFFSKGGRVQRLIHSLKYKGNKQTGVHLGKLFGIDLKKSHLFNDLDVVIPVPLHPKKQFKRGYNQSKYIAIGIANAMGIVVEENNLIRTLYTSTQTKKTRDARWDNVKDAFSVRMPIALKGKHVLIVDDVLTTGATLESCAQSLLKVPDLRVSIATLAYVQG